MSKSSSHNISHKTFFAHGRMRTYLHPTGLKQEYLLHIDLDYVRQEQL